MSVPFPEVTKERLRGSDYRFLLICLALLAGTGWFSFRNFYRAFPEASIDFHVNRGDAGTIAERFLAEQGDKTAAYREASRFSFDDEAKTFLERELGLEQANRVMGSHIRLWRWSYRWFRPQQKEEYSVDVTPAGEVVGFEHQVPEDAPGASPTAEEGRALAEAFLKTRFHRDPAALDFVEQSRVTRPNRVDRMFTWKERDFDVHGATSRIEVTLHGDDPAEYREYLKVPEQWTRDYERLRSKNELASVGDTAVTALLLVGLLATIVLRLRGHDVRWRRASIIGVAGAALSLLAALNEFPLSEFGYRTTDSYGSFISQQFLEALGSALAAGGLLFVLVAGAEPLYRAAFPGRVSLGCLFSLRGLRTRSFFLGAVLGIALAGVFIAYQVAFYLTANRFGAWSPADVPYSDLLNTRFPWLYVLFGGFFPAISEEFLFRMFAIPFLRKLTRSLALAVVLAAFIWGFGHAGYPNQPFYIRGVEVGIGGVALGLIMLRWGILPTLVWHYSVDALYSAMLLLRSHSMYFKLSGAASAGLVALPAIAALAAYFIRGGFEPETGLLNGDEPQAEAQAEEQAAQPRVESAPTASKYRPLTARWRWMAVALALVCLVALAIPSGHFGDSPSFRLSAAQARSSADAFVRGNGFDPSGFRTVAVPSAHWGGDDSLTAKYFLEHGTVAAASHLIERYRPARFWEVRYFKSLEQEEVTAAVNPETGKVTGFIHSVPEDRPGADLPSASARQIAEAFAAAQGWDTSALDLKEAASEMKKARRDYTLTWEARPGDARNVAEARYRVEVSVSGDRVTAARAYWKLPEAWSRARERQNTISIGALALRLAGMAAAAVIAVWLLIQKARRGQVQWRKALALAAAPALLGLGATLLELPLHLRDYSTAMPLETYQAELYASLGISAMFLFIVLGAAVALLESYFPESLTVFRFANRRAMAADAAIAFAAAAALSLAFGKVRAALTTVFPAQALFSVDAPTVIATAAPAAAALADAIRSVVMGAAELAVAALVIRKAPRRWMLAALAVAVVFVAAFPDVHTPAELALEAGFAALRLACAWLFCRWIARDNMLAYALIFWALALRGPMAALFDSGNAVLLTQAWVIAGALAVSIAWALYPALMRRPAASIS